MSEIQTLLVLNGPNLNTLGVREPEIYGSTTLGDVEALCARTGHEMGFEIVCRQSNSEGELVTWIQESRGRYAGLVINAGAYTHTSVAILDALKFAGLPIIEVHISNVFAREAFRHHSYISPVATGVLCGFGIEGYALAIRGLAACLVSPPKEKQ